MDKRSIKNKIKFFFTKFIEHDFLVAIIVIAIISIFLFLPVFIRGQTILPTSVILSTDRLYEGQQFSKESGGNGLLSDLVEIMYPSVYFANESISGGKLPLWNPYTMTGSPFLANGLSSVFEITRLLAYLIGINAIDFFIFSGFLTIFLTGFFTYFFARQISISKYGAIVSSLSFMLSGPMIVWLGYPQSSALIWLPLLLFCVHKIFYTSKTRWIAMASLSVAALLYSGHPQVIFFVFLMIIAYSLFQIIVRIYFERLKTRELSPALIRLLIGFLLGLVLAIPQVVPTIEYVQPSYARQIGRGYYGQMNAIQAIKSGEINAWGDKASIRSNLGDLLLVLYPNLFGNPVYGYLYGYKLADSNPGLDNYNENANYVGILVIILAILAVVYHKNINNNQIVFWFLVSVFCLFIFIDFPIIVLVKYLPVFNIVNLERVRLIFVFSVAVLAGYGVDLLLKEFRKFISSSSGPPIKYFSKDLEIQWPSSVIMFFFIAILVSALPIILAYALFPEGFFRDVIWTLVTFFILIFAAILNFIKLRKDVLFIKIGIFIVVVGQLLYYGIIYHPGSSKELVYPRVKAIEFLRQNIGFYRFTSYQQNRFSYITSALPNSSMIWQLQDIRGYDSLAPYRYELVQRFISHDVFEPMRIHRAYYHSFRGNFFRLFGVKYFIQSKKDSENQELKSRPELKLVYSDDTSNIYENTAVMPRAFVAYNILTVNSPEQALSMFNSPQYDLEKIVLVEVNEDLPIGLENLVAVSNNSIQPAKIVKYDNERVEISTNSNQDSLLVLTDSYYPGWKAFVDGQESKIYPADISFRGVFVPNGKHKVIFIYRPTYWMASVISAITAATIVLILLIIDILKYKKPKLTLNNNAISQ